MKNRTMHLCNTCIHNYPECKSDNIEFGDGYGNDNVISCSGYKSKKDDMFNTCPNCLCTTFVDVEYGKVLCCRCGEVY